MIILRMIFGIIVDDLFVTPRFFIVHEIYFIMYVYEPIDEIIARGQYVISDRVFLQV